MVPGERAVSGEGHEIVKEGQVFHLSYGRGFLGKNGDLRGAHPEVHLSAEEFSFAYGFLEFRYFDNDRFLVFVSKRLADGFQIDRIDPVLNPGMGVYDRRNELLHQLVFPHHFELEKLIVRV